VGQSVLGTVYEKGGGGVVSGAMVRLVDEDGRSNAGWITRGDGRFMLVGRPGVFDLVVERIGFAPRVLEDVTLVEEGITSVDIAVETAAIRLEGLTVEAGGRGCPRVDGGDATQVIWDEARKALMAASWTEQQQELQFDLLQWDRYTDARTDTVIEEDWTDRRSVGANSVTTLPPEDLEAAGYVRTSPAGVSYYGPDAETLLSSSFLDSHCFHVVRPAEEDAPLVGLEFEPVEGRELADIRGTIWLDERDARLERVEFVYTGARRRTGRVPAEGEVRFAELADGRWFVQDWFIRVPQAVRRPSVLDPFREDLVSFHEVGSRVEQVRGERVLWTNRLARGSIAGAIFDSISMRPLTRADVRLSGRPGVVADALGRFEIERLPPGEYRVSFSHPSIDTLGVTAGWTRVVVEPGTQADVQLVIPAWETLVSRECGEEGSIVGRVRDELGRPLTGATVSVTGPSGLAEARTDRLGVYGLCGVARPEGIELVARAGSATATRRVAAEPTAHLREDLIVTVPATQFRSAPTAGAVRPGLLGTVLEAETLRPLEGVTVELVDGRGRSVGRSLSGPDGSFRIRLDGGGQLQIRVERLGFASGEVGEPLDLTSGAQRVEIRMAEEPVALDPVLVMIDGRVDKLESVGFYGRALTRPGTFLIRDDVDVLDPARVTDLLGRAPGMRLSSSFGDLKRRVVFRSLALTEGERCYPSLFIDGELVQIGGLRTGEDGEFFPLDDDDLLGIDEVLAPSEIEGLELYGTPALIPQEFVGMGTRCGAVVIWTRRP
jgi:hypothetical protein